MLKYKRSNISDGVLMTSRQTQKIIPVSRVDRLGLLPWENLQNIYGNAGSENRMLIFRAIVISVSYK